METVNILAQVLMKVIVQIAHKENTFITNNVFIVVLLIFTVLMERIAKLVPIMQIPEKNV